MDLDNEVHTEEDISNILEILSQCYLEGFDRKTYIPIDDIVLGGGNAKKYHLAYDIVVAAAQDNPEIFDLKLDERGFSIRIRYETFLQKTFRCISSTIMYYLS